MNELSQFLVDSILNEAESDVITALFGGGFKPPTKGHLEVVLKAIQDNPEIDQVYIIVGAGVRNGISQEQSVKIWEKYKKLIPKTTEIIEAGSPISWIKDYLKDHSEDKTYILIGAREGDEEDEKDLEQRSNLLQKYGGEIKPIYTKGGISGTKAREAAKQSKEAFYQFIPDQFSDSDKEEIYNIIIPTLNEVDELKENLNENATYSSDIDYKQHIKELTKHMLEKGMNITPLPKVIFRNGDSNNARNFFGKTAYYDPNTQTIVLYTEGRHPKDIVRSFSHEMIHHIQNLEGRLGNIQGTNTMEDDHLDKLEQEANLNGTMTFRNWTDSLNEKKNKDPFGINQYARELAKGLEEELDEGRKKKKDPKTGTGKKLDIPGGLEEGKQVGLLYHFTSTNSLDKILKDNKINGSFMYEVGDKELYGVSTTRNKNLNYDLQRNNVRITLDGNKLSNNYKITPRDYFERQYNIPDNPQTIDEDEEVILTPKGYINNIKNYILAVDKVKDLEESRKKKKDPKKGTGKKPEGSGRKNFNVENVRQVPINENVPSAKDDGKATPYGSGYEKVKEEMFQSSKIENQLKQKYLEVLEKLFLFEKGNYIELNLIKIKPEYKGKGWATKILDDLSEYAQENNKILTLTPSDTFGASKSRLEKFYKRFGFVPNKGKNKDFTTKDTMIRPLSEDTSELFTIYLDMDGVIADFDKRFTELAGMGPREYEDSFGTEKFWDFIDNKHGVKFWTGIEWMPEGQKLYNFVKQFDHKLLSAPSRNDASKIGKRMWAKKNTPGTQLILAAAVNKQNYADKSNILIDDREKNIQQWKDAGGIGILFKSTDQVIDELKKIMNL